MQRHCAMYKAYRDRCFMCISINRNLPSRICLCGSKILFMLHCSFENAFMLSILNIENALISNQSITIFIANFNMGFFLRYL